MNKIWTPVLFLVLVVSIVFAITGYKFNEIERRIKIIETKPIDCAEKKPINEGFFTRYSDGVYHIRVHFDGNGDPKDVIIVDSDKGKNWVIE